MLKACIRMHAFNRGSECKPNCYNKQTEFDVFRNLVWENFLVFNESDVAISSWRCRNRGWMGPTLLSNEDSDWRRSLWALLKRSSMGHCASEESEQNPSWGPSHWLLFATRCCRTWQCHNLRKKQKRLRTKRKVILNMLFFAKKWCFHVWKRAVFWRNILRAHFLPCFFIVFWTHKKKCQLYSE